MWGVAGKARVQVSFERRRRLAGIWSAAPDYPTTDVASQSSAVRCQPLALLACGLRLGTRAQRRQRRRRARSPRTAAPTFGRLSACRLARPARTALQCTVRSLATKRGQSGAGSTKTRLGQPQAHRAGSCRDCRLRKHNNDRARARRRPMRLSRDRTAVPALGRARGGVRHQRRTDRPRAAAAQVEPRAGRRGTSVQRGDGRRPVLLAHQPLGRPALGTCGRHGVPLRGGAVAPGRDARVGHGVARCAAGRRGRLARECTAPRHPSRPGLPRCRCRGRGRRPARR